MSVVFTKSPADFQPVLSDDLYFVSSADTSNKYKFRYVYTLLVEDTPVFSGKCTPNPYGLGIIDLQQVLETYTYNNPISYWNTTPIYTHQTFPFSRPSSDEVINYQIKCGYEYADTALGVVTGFTGVGDAIGLPAYRSSVYKTFRSTMGVNGRATQQTFNFTPFVLSGTPTGVNPTTSGMFLTNSPRYRRIDPSEYYTLAFTNYYLTQNTGSTLSEPYYVKYSFYDDQGLLITAYTYDNITTNGGGPRTNCNQVYQAMFLQNPASGTTEYNTLYVGAGPANISNFPSNAVQYTVQLFGQFTGSTSPILPTPTPTPTSRTPCVCREYEFTSLAGISTLTYLNCSETQYVFVESQEGQTQSFCACQGSVSILSGFEYLLTDNGSCVVTTPTPTPTAACSGCTTYAVEYTGDSINATVTYQNCNTGAFVNLIAYPGFIYQICACQLPIDTGDVGYTNLGSCVPGATPTPTPTLTRTPTPTPSIATYTYLGRTTPDQDNGPTACSSYLTARSYTGLKPLASLTVGDYLYDSYPGSPTDGNNLWVALKVGGAGAGYAFQVADDGEILDTYTC
jgi:hypothetical protein